jgi:hypothetical protein
VGGDPSFGEPPGLAALRGKPSLGQCLGVNAWEQLEDESKTMVSAGGAMGECFMVPDKADVIASGIACDTKLDLEMNGLRAAIKCPVVWSIQVR